MRKPQTKKITVMINEDLQKMMQKLRDDTSINWSEYIKNCVREKIKAEMK
jgi:hypothetical protein